MKKIASFEMDHDVLTPGIYISRVDFDDIVTYDIRLKTPNMGDYLDPAAAHTIEHLFATAVRNGCIGSNVVYFGPMGCLTGFYLLTKGCSHTAVIGEIRRIMAFIRDFTGKIPGSEKKECGNYLFHDLKKARAEAQAFIPVIADWQEADLAYPQAK
ncbi:MAG: S-ribosylhomocysteine lyase [Christensenellaceae bacterium]|nr:S-ribosylhomocysteine lyase [Christensenellaceae bacterium]